MMMVSECVGALGEGSKFQSVRGPQKLHFRVLSSRSNSLTHGSSLPYRRFLPQSQSTGVLKVMINYWLNSMQN